MLVLLALLGCATDADYDGFDEKEDCDDTNALVYPGAPDDPADGLDADCDGSDPDWAFVGDWEVSQFTVDYGGFDIFIPGTESGTLAITSEMTADLDVVATLDPDIAGFEIDLDIVLEGDASSIAGRDEFAVYVGGYQELADEDLTLELFCATLDGVADCAGTLKVIETTVTVIAAFEQQ